jgi:hypothetical protein
VQPISFAKWVNVDTVVVLAQISIETIAASDLACLEPQTTMLVQDVLLVNYQSRFQEIDFGEFSMQHNGSADSFQLPETEANSTHSAC